MPRRTVRVHQVDVFTRSRFRGNPAGVVLDADGLPDGILQDIAREMNLSETAFVHACDDQGRVPVRFFTPTAEVPICGHATLAAHFVRAFQGDGTSGRVVQTAAGGEWEVRWERREGGPFLTMVQGPVTWGDPLGGDHSAQLMRALGIAPENVREGWPIQPVGTGHAKIMVPIAHVDVLRAITPDMGALRILSEDVGVGGVFVFATEGTPDGAFTEARMFGPAIGVPEDPVNGSGHGPLGAYLTARGSAWADVALSGFWSAMGGGLRRDGRVWTRVHPDRTAVDVGGFVVPVFDAFMELEW